jgi:hypothetical protein
MQHDKMPSYYRELTIQYDMPLHLTTRLKYLVLLFFLFNSFISNQNYSDSVS